MKVETFLSNSHTRVDLIPLKICELENQFSCICVPLAHIILSRDNYITYQNSFTKFPENISNKYVLIQLKKISEITLLRKFSKILA